MAIPALTNFTVPAGNSFIPSAAGFPVPGGLTNVGFQIDVSAMPSQNSFDWMLQWQYPGGAWHDAQGGHVYSPWLGGPNDNTPMSVATFTQPIPQAPNYPTHGRIQVTNNLQPGGPSKISVSLV